MAIKKIQMKPEGNNDYGDVLHPETSADQVKISSGGTVEDLNTDLVTTNTNLSSLQGEVSSHSAKIATETELGHVKVDNKSILVNPEGLISVNSRHDENKYLFDYGITDVEWVEGYKIVASAGATAYVRINQASLEIRNQMAGSKYPGVATARSLVTDTLVDFSGYNYLVVNASDFSIGGGGMPANIVALVVSRTKGGDVNDYDAKISLGRGTSFMGVRNLNGEYYVRIHCFATGTSGSSNSVSRITAERVYLSNELPE